MNKAMAFVVSMVVATSALAQTNGQPPEQVPAGNPGKFHKQPLLPKTSESAPKAAPAKPLTKAERRAARKETRAEKVGDKPID